ncbi:MAG: DUF1365 domain-containing protein [Bythopirellula sp.]|nr:DUF1365 domain-containing protein [Bythopirellula sp.]
MHSALYHGSVTHSRTRPISHSFRYPVTMAYLDLAEVPQLLRERKLLGYHWRPLCFREEDHLLGAGESLDAEIRTLVQSQTRERLSGPIRLLTLLCTWGYYFSPLNLYYCFAPDGELLEAIVAEVSNTPWLETHRYVLSVSSPAGPEPLHWDHPKEFHVSPFMGMDLDYGWRCSQPGEQIGVQITTAQAGESFFTANLNLERRPISDVELAWSLYRYPWMTARVVSAIYWQALRLWWKKCPFYTHPKKQAASHGTPTS